MVLENQSGIAAGVVAQLARRSRASSPMRSPAWAREYADGVVGEVVPVDEELRCARCQEYEPGGVDRPMGVGVEVGVEGLAERVGGQEIAAGADDERRRGDRVEDTLHARPYSLLSRPPRCAALAAREDGARKVEEVA